VDRRELVALFLVEHKLYWSACETVEEAAAESGYSEEHLRRLAREGGLPVERNGGSKSKIKVRRGDLPTKQRGDGLRTRCPGGWLQ
jgi:hypothetical protein